MQLASLFLTFLDPSEFQASSAATGADCLRPVSLIGLGKCKNTQVSYV
jgi:hypothetical protein